MSELMQVGVVGVGSRGRYLGRSFRDHSRTTLVAVCDVSREALEYARQDFGKSIRYYSDLGEMCQKEALDIGVVASWDPAHRDHAVTFLEHDLHVYHEKPMARSGSSPIRVFGEVGLDVFGGNEPDDKRCRSCDRRDTCPDFLDVSRFVYDYGEKAKHAMDFCAYAREVDVDDNCVIRVRYANGAKMTYTECHFTPDYNRHFTLKGCLSRSLQPPHCTPPRIAVRSGTRPRGQAEMHPRQAQFDFQATFA